MAIVVAGNSSVNLSSFNTQTLIGGVPLSATATQVQIENTAGVTVTFTGNFTYSPPLPVLGGGVSGTITGYEEEGRLTITQLNIDVAQFLGDVVAGRDSAIPTYALAGNDRITGSNFADTLFGYAGNDIVLARDGNDAVNGNAGNDVIDGGLGNDTLTGFIGNDALRGGGGNDRLSAGAGRDVMVGGAGRDLLTGGTGTDFFTFLRFRDGIDTITDFAVAQDVIRIARAGFGSGLTVGQLPATRFVRGAAAQDANDRFIYNPTNGVLSFDADGTGPFAAVRLAVLSNRAGLVASNIQVV